MISSGDVEKHFFRLPGELLDILLEIHRMVLLIAPQSSAEIRRYGIVYYDASRGGPVSAGICQALIKPDHIRLAFIHGAFLPDPDYLLQGSSNPKRYLKITSFDHAPWEVIQQWIITHAQFDPRTLPENSMQK